MKKYVEERTLKVRSIVCDICGRESLLDSDQGEFCRAINYTTIRKVFGYMSKIGDGVELEMDLCEDCLIDKFGEELLQERSI